MTYWVVAMCLVILFGAIVLRGAPYVPTHRRTVQLVLDALGLDAGDVVVDLGSGDGSFVKAAALRGLKAVGYELNPLLCLVAWVRCWPVRDRTSIRLRDFWLSALPTDTKAIYFFLAGPFMRRIKRKLEQDMLRRTAPLLVASNGFAIPGLLPKKVVHGVYIYELKPQA